MSTNVNRNRYLFLLTNKYYNTNLINVFLKYLEAKVLQFKQYNIIIKTYIFFVKCFDMYINIYIFNDFPFSPLII